MTLLQSLGRLLTPFLLLTLLVARMGTVSGPVLFHPLQDHIQGRATLVEDAPSVQTSLFKAKRIPDLLSVVPLSIGLPQVHPDGATTLPVPQCVHSTEVPEEIFIPPETSA